MFRLNIKGFFLSYYGWITGESLILGAGALFSLCFLSYYSFQILSWALWASSWSLNSSPFFYFFLLKLGLRRLISSDWVDYTIWGDLARDYFLDEVFRDGFSCETLFSYIEFFNGLSLALLLFPSVLTSKKLMLRLYSIDLRIFYRFSAWEGDIFEFCWALFINFFDSSWICYTDCIRLLTWLSIPRIVILIWSFSWIIWSHLVLESPSIARLWF